MCNYKQTALNHYDRPWHPKLENYTTNQATLLLEKVYDRDKEDVKWHFQEILDDPAHVRTEFQEESVIFWFRSERISARIRELLSLYGFKEYKDPLIHGSVFDSEGAYVLVGYICT